MKKQKILIISALGFLSVLIGFFVFLKVYTFKSPDNLLNRLQVIFFEKNSITVTGENVDLDKVTIECLEPSQGIVFEKGRKVAKIKNEYGGDSFKIFYDKKPIAMAWIFKTNWWHTHDYFFDITKIDTTFQFKFNVIGPNSESLEYKTYKIDSLNRKSTEVFYDNKGIDGQVNVEYYNKDWKLIVDEIWINDTLKNLNVYQNGEWKKNYSTNKYHNKTKTYNLIKENRSDSLIYIYETIGGGIIDKERIGIKQIEE